jgi:hypothetical protein
LLTLAKLKYKTIQRNAKQNHKVDNIINKYGISFDLIILPKKYFESLC